MERIVIEVNEATAKRWKTVSDKMRNFIEKSFEKQIDYLSKSEQEAHFEGLLEKAREEAAKNGLTDEVLEKLLNEQ